MSPSHCSGVEGRSCGPPEHYRVQYHYLWTRKVFVAVDAFPDLFIYLFIAIGSCSNACSKTFSSELGWGSGKVDEVLIRREEYFVVWLE